jgi:hypothetical protein
MPPDLDLDGVVTGLGQINQDGRNAAAGSLF